MLTLSTIIAAFHCCRAEEYPPCKKEAKACIGIDLIGGLCFKAFRLSGSHCLHEHWTASAEVSIDFGALHHKEDTIWDEHRETIDNDIDNTRDKSHFRRPVHEINIGLTFWPASPFKGINLTIGGRMRDRSDPDITIGIGYSLKIVQGVYGMIAYNTGIIETKRTGRLTLEGIRAGINYIF